MDTVKRSSARRLTMNEKAAIIQLRVAGLSMAAIAKQFNISRIAVWVTYKKYLPVKNGILIVRQSKINE